MRNGKQWTDVNEWNRNPFGSIEVLRPGIFASVSGEIIFHKSMSRGLA